MWKKNMWTTDMAKKSHKGGMQMCKDWEVLG